MKNLGCLLTDLHFPLKLFLLIHCRNKNTLTELTSKSAVGSEKRQIINSNINNVSTSAETSILKSTNRAFKDYKINPHYDLKERMKLEEPDDGVWEK